MKYFKTEFKWGLIFAAGTFIVFFLSNMLGWQTTETISKHLSIAFGGFLLLNLVCLWMGLREKKSLASDNHFSFGQSMKTGVIITVVAALFGAFFLCFFMCYLNTDFLDVTTAHQISEGIIKEDETVTYGKFITEFITHSLIIGTVFTLILTLFIRSKPS